MFTVIVYNILFIKNYKDITRIVVLLPYKRKEYLHDDSELLMDIKTVTENKN